MTPIKAKDEDFLSNLEEMAPDLCITAAYGQWLPKRFLSIPKLGTINVHPSLLPLFRGAAPVQRCLERGDSSTGVSIVETVLKMDAGPVIKQLNYPLSGDEKASDFRSTKCDDCCLCSYSNPQLRRPNHETRRNADGSE